MSKSLDSQTLPPLVGVRPMVLLSGFLGAGKTTFLRLCLKALTEHHLVADIILNDRENPEIDCETLRDHAASVSALAGSCVCCEGLDELAGLVIQASQTRHDVLFVELNGTADPVPLLESFTLLESRFLMRPRWQVCVIDARHFGSRGNFSGLEELQLETASHFVISHQEGVSEARHEDLRARVQDINPRASETNARSLAQQLVQAVAQNRPVTVGRAGIPERTVNWSLPMPRSLSTRHQLAHEFTGCQILLPEPLPSANLRSWLLDLPESVIRAKALVRTVEHPDARYLFERVGRDLSPNPLRVAISERVPASAIMIGADLEPSVLLEAARRQLDENCKMG